MAILSLNLIETLHFFKVSHSEEGTYQCLYMVWEGFVRQEHIYKKSYRVSSPLSPPSPYYLLWRMCGSLASEDKEFVVHKGTWDELCVEKESERKF